jgi:alpha-L-rhamnosidase
MTQLPFDGTATWIAGPAGDDHAPAPLLRTTVDLDREPDDAILSLAAGGTARAWVNGDPVGKPGELAPAFADYRDRVYARTDDVAESLGPGENAIAVTLGRGRYALSSQRIGGEWGTAPWRADRPCLLARLEIECSSGNETVVSGPTWRAAPGPTQFDSLYEGEHVDARNARPGWRGPHYEDGDWGTAAPVAGPAGTLQPQPLPSIREIRRVHPTSIEAIDPETWVVDFGEMVAGWTALDVGADGIRLQTDRYVCRGEGREAWASQFTYKGFRFLQVEVDDPSGLDEWAVEAVVAHTPVEAGGTGTFGCGDCCLKRIHENTRRALLNNYHDVPTDTPVFEKNGWTGDAQWTATAALYDLSPEDFFRKWLDDFADSQLDTGELPPIVPTPDYGYHDPEHDNAVQSPNPAWDATYPILVWRLYEFTGDERILESHLDNCRELVDYYGREWAIGGPGGIVEQGLGDWVTPNNPDFPFPQEGTGITGTTHYYRMADLVARIAATLGRDDTAAAYRDLAADTRDACNEAYLDGDVYRTGEVDEYRQTSNVLPLAFDLVPDSRVEAVRDRLVHDVRETHDRHLNTGALGTRYLLGVLTDCGHADLAYDVATQTTYPSWGHWIVEQDATALYEGWELDVRSRDHHFLGSAVDWYYRHLAGIAPAEPGFETVRIAPATPAALPWAGATVETPNGPVTTRWDRVADGIELDVALPDGVPGRVHVPATDGVTVEGGSAAVADDTSVGPVDGTVLRIDGDRTISW